MILYRVVFFEDLNIKENVILSALYNLRDAKKINIASFATAFNISQDTIYNTLKELEAKEYIYIERHFNWQKQKRQNNYILQAKTLDAYKPKEQKKKESAKIYKSVVEAPAWYDKYKNNIDKPPTEEISAEALKASQGLFTDEEEKPRPFKKRGG